MMIIIRLITFFVNFGVLISMKAAWTAFIKLLVLLKVTLPEPEGKLQLLREKMTVYCQETILDFKFILASKNPATLRPVFKLVPRSMFTSTNRKLAKTSLSLVLLLKL